MTDALPLAVDLDGTLIKTDMSRVTIRRVVVPRPWLLMKVTFLEIIGKRARWKRDLGRRLNFNPAELEYHQEFLAWLTEQKKSGRELILCTASERAVAEKIANHVGLFSDVMASDGEVNLRKQAKAEALVARFGEGKFAYAGNSSHDFPVWEKAGEVIVVNASTSVQQRMAARTSMLFE
jgi:phosphoserine phosphatase